MSKESAEKTLKAVRDYAAGLVGTRETMRRGGLSDYAELVITLAQHNLDLPKPADTAERRANVERAAAILQPLLQNAR
jgi:hypothetical protein